MIYLGVSPGWVDELYGVEFHTVIDQAETQFLGYLPL